MKFFVQIKVSDKRIWLTIPDNLNVERVGCFYDSAKKLFHVYADPEGSVVIHSKKKIVYFARKKWAPGMPLGAYRVEVVWHNDQFTTPISSPERRPKALTDPKREGDALADPVPAPPQVSSVDLKFRALDFAKGDFVLARRVYNWLVAGTATTILEETAPPPETTKPVTRQAPLKIIPKMSAHALRAAISIYYSGGVVNGVALSAALKCSQSNASAHIRKLTKYGYLLRNGNKWRPIYDPKGERVAPVKTILPARAAKGYKPLQGRLEDIARISHAHD